MSLVSGRKDGCGGGTSMMMGFMGRVAARLRCLDFDKCVGHFYFEYYMYLSLRSKFEEEKREC